MHTNERKAVQHADMRNTVDTFQAFAYSLCGDIKEKGNTGAGLTLALQKLMNCRSPNYFNVRPSVDTLLSFSKMDDEVRQMTTFRHAHTHLNRDTRRDSDTYGYIAIRSDT